MKTFYSYISFLLLIFICFACTKDETTSTQNNLIYYNSFENSKDLKGFEGYAHALTANVSEEAGDSSLIVDGGCIAPHTYFDIPILNEMDITFSALVRSEYQHCGSFELISLKSGMNIYSSINSNEWITIKSDKILHVSDFDTIRVSIVSGGKIACPSYIDEFKIERVK